MTYRLRPQQLEAHVIELVDLVLAGGRVEDDLVECKGQWPDPQNRRSARQLAGHANKAHDEPILWIIGLDEDARALTQPPPVEVANWWPAMSSRFDQEVPELEHHLVVHIGERQAVTALRFLTDRSPYVITSGGEDGTLDRGVPIRDGARTRSARRDELVRLLIPAVAPPAAQLLSVRFDVAYTPIEGGEGYTQLDFRAAVFFQQPATPAGVVMLPAHRMHGRIDYDRGFRSRRWKLHYRDSHTPPIISSMNEPPPVRPKPTYGVSGSPDGVVITGPGTLHVFAGERLNGDHRSMFAGRLWGSPDSSEGRLPGASR